MNFVWGNHTFVKNIWMKHNLGLKVHNGNEKNKGFLLIQKKSKKNQKKKTQKTNGTWDLRDGMYFTRKLKKKSFTQSTTEDEIWIVKDKGFSLLH